ncbi:MULTISPECIES: DUF429 domain-containing protein [unclassified Leifsonia]|uniref:DUF429 domain-containing protein n=1 Tax=unclassified Leifsonia TaxID=2663824 RepID=UPI0007001F16|nr:MULTISPECIES: DUF429 domain-containing protein [unclassified Leifsonia]KQX08163.1 hypothetical protein ASC59_10860 [Leifsonia sp. Root1293]KRA12444.1 hypothetical protein ASD61_10860 [Leifsonia sp. Root60]
MPLFLGVDLAWGEGTATRAANETGLAAIAADGTVIDAGWARGINEVERWLLATASVGDVIAIDAPLVVANRTGMRECEREVGRRYGRWKVSANASNLGLGWLAGVTLRRRLEAAGFTCISGTDAARDDIVQFFECYPYTTLVGAVELGYDGERPRYKRPNLAIPASERREFRAHQCDDLIARLAALTVAETPLDLGSHPVTHDLLNTPSPLTDAAYKHREDLIDAVICAWTASLWARHHLDRCQVLGADSQPDDEGRLATIVAPARPEQRRPREH